MDNLGSRAAEARFVPDRRYTFLAAGGFVVALVAVLLAGDGPSRLIAAVAALVLLGYALSDLVFSPRLTISTEGVTIRSPLTRARLPWSQIDSVRADVRLRHGLRSTTLEIDAGSVLAVLSRRALGAEPQDVADLADAFRPG